MRLIKQMTRSTADESARRIARITALNAEDLNALTLVTDRLLDTIESERGAAVIAIDAQGDGNALVVLVGNSLMTTPLMQAMGQAAPSFDECEGGVH